jgi:hypothetical protein
LEAVKEEIYKYKNTYHQGAHDRLVEKLSETNIQSFETVVHIFKIEFQPPAPTQKLIGIYLSESVFFAFSLFFYKFLKTFWQRSFTIFQPIFDCLNFLSFLIFTKYKTR